MALSASEEIFIKRFIERPLRERWLKRLASPKTRHKQVNRLAHTFVLDLDGRYVYDKDNVPAAVAAQIQKLLTDWKQTEPQQLCSIIALGSELDGQMLSLQEAEQEFQSSLGAVIIIIPDKLAYYHTERSNLSKQPFYVLFRP